jgi:hypothetical protein
MNKYKVNSILPPINIPLGTHYPIGEYTGYLTDDEVKFLLRLGHRVTLIEDEGK